jgi:hypothetical protein
MPGPRSIATFAILAAIYGCSTQSSDPSAPVASAAPVVTAESHLAQRAPLDGARAPLDGARASRDALRARRGPPRVGSIASTPDDAPDFAPAARRFAAHHDPAAQLLTEGGPILAAPHIVPVFFPGDPKMSTLVDFTQRYVASQFWQQAVGEYGVGAGTVGAPVIRDEVAPPTIFDVDIDAWLIAKLDAHDPLLPPPDANTVYALFFPPGTVVQFSPYAPGAPIAQSCTNFGAYHSSVTLASGQNVVEAVVPRCDQGYRSYTPAEQLTLAPAHELAEAATDPFPGGSAAFDLLDFNGSALGLVEGAEIGDMCEFIQTSVASNTDVGYPVQRLWSNRAAAASHDPCFPTLGSAYFNAAPVVGGTEVYPAGYVHGITLPPGGTVTLDVELFSDAPTAPWALAAREIDGLSTLTMTFDEPQGKNGDVRHLTITRGSDQSTVAQAEIDSTLDGKTNSWPLVLGY